MPNDIKLHMGFINTPYTKETMARPMTSAKAESKRKRRRGFSRTMTADKVGNILENKYNIVDTFSAVYEQEIAQVMKQGFAEVAADMLAKGKGYTRSNMKSLMKPYTDQVEAMFRGFLSREEMNGMVDGVPTKAALGGIRRGRRRVQMRPSFINTGIYRASFRCWADTK
jgi:hypothetical protein